MFTHNYVSFLQNLSNPLFKDLKLLKLHNVLESGIIKFFYKFSRIELPKSVCRKLNLVHKVRTRNTRNNFLIYSPRMSISRYGNHSLRGDGASLWNKSFKCFLSNHDLTSFFKLKSFLMKRFHKLTKMNCKLLTRVQTIFSRFLS